MKKLSVLTLFVILGLVGFGQKLVKNEHDEFTGKLIKETDVNKLILGGGKMYYYKLYQWNDNCQLILKIVDGKTVESAYENDILYLKFENGKIFELHNKNFTVSCVGCGSFGLGCSECIGIELTYNFTKKDIAQLTESPLVKIRVVLNDKYLENDINKKRSNTFISALELLK